MTARTETFPGPAMEPGPESSLVLIGAIVFRRHEHYELTGLSTKERALKPLDPFFVSIPFCVLPTSFLEGGFIWTVTSPPSVVTFPAWTAARQMILLNAYKSVPTTRRLHHIAGGFGTVKGEPLPDQVLIRHAGLRKFRIPFHLLNILTDRSG